MKVLRNNETTMRGSPEVYKPDVVCVLGMHRSGTSLLTRILNLVGFYLGPEQELLQGGEQQPSGFWEYLQIIYLNEAILERHGGSWDAPPVSPLSWETDPTIDDLGQRARTLIQNTFADSEMWGWKDPRNCLTLPFWQQLLPDMRYVICLRNPVDVAHSLALRNGFSAQKSSSLWFRYVSSALKHSEGKPRLIVFYEDLMDDWLSELRRLCNFLGKPERAEQTEVQESVHAFIEKGLQHHRTSAVSAMAKSDIDFRAKSLYIAQRISESFGQNQENTPPGLEPQIEKALDVLSQYALKESGQENPFIEVVTELEAKFAASSNTNGILRRRVQEQDEELQGISERLAGRDHAIQELSIQLANKEIMVAECSEQIAEFSEQIAEFSEQIAKGNESARILSSQLVEKDRIVQMLSEEIAEKDLVGRSRAEFDAERIGALSALLLDTQTQLTRMRETLGWRLLSQYGRIKYRYLLPVYQLFRPGPTEPESRSNDE